MNWGTKIIIGMLCFMSFIIVLAVMMFRSDTDALVDQDYYEKGLKYDETYRLKENVLHDDVRPEVTADTAAITLRFKTSAAGSIKMVRIADKTMDRELRFDTDPENKVVLPTAGLAAGRWKLIVKWTAASGDSYLAEHELFIP
ncbi:MAG: nitrogen fixation protein FixH [Chitinophagaceae bacterium]|nr:MAG: nitrogen fixation protein FixH [Chitinophagaceae bacterium]